MGRTLSHIVVELGRFYLTWLIYIIGNAQIILLLGIHNAFRFCDCV